MGEDIGGSSMPDRILAVALDQFLQRGYEAATTREITDALGITPAALYYHFRSKEACLVTLVTPYLDALEAVIGSRNGPVTDEAAAREFLELLHDVLVDHVRIVYLIDRDLAVATTPPLNRRIDRATNAAHSRLAGPRPDQSALIRASAGLGALRRPLLRLGATDPPDREPVIDAALAALQFPTTADA